MVWGAFIQRRGKDTQTEVMNKDFVFLLLLELPLLSLKSTYRIFFEYLVDKQRHLASSFTPPYLLVLQQFGSNLLYILSSVWIFLS